MSPNVSILSSIDSLAGPLTPSDLWSFEAYASARAELVRELIRLKRARRVRVGEHCSLVFETRASVWFQIHEQLHLQPDRRASRAGELLAEYAELVPTPRELRASLFLECTAPRLARRLSLHLAEHIDALRLNLPAGQFAARPLEPLTTGIAGVAFLRFVQQSTFVSLQAPSLRWSAPDYSVLSELKAEVVHALLHQLALATPRVPAHVH